MMDYQKHIGEEKSKEEIKEKYHDPQHKEMNILESVDNQCGLVERNWIQ